MCLFGPHQRMHTPPHQEVSHQFQEAIGSWKTEVGNNSHTPGHRGDLHLLAVSLVGWLYHHLQIPPPGLPSQSLLNSRTNICTALISGKG